MEHFWLYFRCFVIASVILYALWYVLIGRTRKEENFSVNLDDIGGSSAKTGSG